MLSLPTIPPRADTSLWPSLRTTHAPSHDETPPSPTNPQAHQRRPSHHNSHPYNGYSSPSRSLLAQLTSEENKISQRKQNISRYGSTWIRPPGVPKTFQAIEDEKAEREEQEAIARREQAMMDLAAAQQEAANAEAREEGDEMEEEGEEGERDLDDEVPEAEEADSSDLGASEEESENSMDEEEEADTQEGDTSHNTADVTFNEDSFIEGSMLEEQVSHMLAMEEASMAGTLQEERDLDDDIPEAGSYEHTDSSAIDSSSEGEGPSNSSFHAPPPVRRRRSERREARQSSGRRSSGLGMASAARHRSGATNTRSGGTRNTRSGGASNTRARGSVMDAPPPRMQMLGMDVGMRMGQMHQQHSSRLSLEFDGSSSVLELEGSSFLRSSPAVARANDLRARFMGARGR